MTTETPKGDIIVDSKSELKNIEFANSTNETVFLAIAYYNNSKWESHGYYRIEQNDFRNIEYTPLWIKECKAFGDYLNTLSDDELISAFNYLPVKLRSDINLTKKAISKKTEYLE